MSYEGETHLQFLITILEPLGEEFRCEKKAFDVLGHLTGHYLEL